jgi:hypothetical protein
MSKNIIFLLISSVAERLPASQVELSSMELVRREILQFQHFCVRVIDMNAMQAYK